MAMTGTNPSDYPGDLNRPVENVYFGPATDYCTMLTQRERAAGRIATNCVYRLPTEAEWEYACRAGTSTRFYYGDDPGYTNLTNYAWYGAKSGDITHPVGQKLPNAWGLYDMHGNVWNWCQDWFDYYTGGLALDPQGPSNPTFFPRSNVIRGGRWSALARFCRSAERRFIYPIGQPGLGFRVILAPGQP
jgi:formylglycine-generating enzyme required for sulfatase activity